MCRTLIIEPGNDDLFGPNNGHAAALQARLRYPVNSLRIQGGHSDIEHTNACWGRLDQFITQEAGPVNVGV
uniref:Homoserine acetyltransferase n=1 Tax=Panagrellus redivivus TaxID=6233 RepID=A0A7E4UN06_PANRE